jgi:hypothetical protein
MCKILHTWPGVGGVKFVVGDSTRINVILTTSLELMPTYSVSFTFNSKKVRMTTCGVVTSALTQVFDLLVRNTSLRSTASDIDTQIQRKVGRWRRRATMLDSDIRRHVELKQVASTE